MYNLVCKKSCLPVFLVSAVLLVSVSSASMAETAKKKITVKRYSAVVSKQSGLKLPGEMKKLNFKFSNSEISAWVRDNGEWHIQGLVSHKNFFCADYSLGIRLGQGHPGCIDVKWLTEDQYATKKKQCNNVSMNHDGYQSNPEIAKIFSQITCAQGLVRCVGSCK